MARPRLRTADQTRRHLVPVQPALGEVLIAWLVPLHAGEGCADDAERVCVLVALAVARCFRVGEREEFGR